MSSTTPKPETHDREDALLAALRELPSRPVDATYDARMQREARAAYVRSFEGSVWHGEALGGVSRAVVPVFLAAIVGLYMSWAIGAALVH